MVSGQVYREYGEWQMSEGFENIITNAVASANIENSYPTAQDILFIRKYLNGKISKKKFFKVSLQEITEPLGSCDELLKTAVSYNENNVSFLYNIWR